MYDQFNRIKTVGGLPFSLTIQQVTVVVSLNNIRDNYLYCPGTTSEQRDQVQSRQVPAIKEERRGLWRLIPFDKNQKLMRKYIDLCDRMILNLAFPYTSCRSYNFKVFDLYLQGFSILPAIFVIITQ